MALNRKKLQPKTIPRSEPPASSNGHERNVDPGVSASQMAPVLLDYYAVRPLLSPDVHINVHAHSVDYIHGPRWLLRVRVTDFYLGQLAIHITLQERMRI